MPRLKGKPSNNNLSLVLLTGLILVAVAVPLEYFNVTNFATNANESPSVGGVNQPPAIATDTIDKVEKIDK